MTGHEEFDFDAAIKAIDALRESVEMTGSDVVNGLEQVLQSRYGGCNKQESWGRLVDSLSALATATDGLHDKVTTSLELPSNEELRTRRANDLGALGHRLYTSLLPADMLNRASDTDCNPALEIEIVTGNVLRTRKGERRLAHSTWIFAMNSIFGQLRLPLGLKAIRQCRDPLYDEGDTDTSAFGRRLTMLTDSVNKLADEPIIDRQATTGKEAIYTVNPGVYFTDLRPIDKQYRPDTQV